MSKRFLGRPGSARLSRRTPCPAFLLTISLCVLSGVGPHARASVRRPPSARPSPQQPQDAAQQGAQGAVALEPGKAIERELSGGQKHVYQFTLAAGQYASIVVEQRGVDVGVRLQGEGGKAVAESDSEPRSHGQERVELVAGAAGTYRVVVEARALKAPAGGYAVRLAESRAATEDDRALQEARAQAADAVGLRRAAKYDEALRAAARALEIRERLQGSEHPDLTASLNNLAETYLQKNDLAKAEQMYARALGVREKALGPEHPLVARSLNSLGIFYFRRRGDFDRADQLFGRALAISEKVLGPEHPEVAAALINLGNIRQAKGDYERARQFYLRALAVREKAFGPEHTDVAQTLNSLGIIHRNVGEFERATELYERALQLRVKALGPEHPDVAQSLNNLAEVYRVKGDYVRAEQLHERALAVREKALGPEHQDVASSLNNLGIIADLKGDAEKAERLYGRSLAILEKVFGPEHPFIASAFNNLALIHTGRGDLDRAEQLYQRALQIKEKSLGPESPEVATSLNSLADLYVLRGELDKAEQLYARARSISEKALGPEHHYVASTLNNLARVRRGKGDHGQAEQLYLRALAIREKALGPEHPFVAKTLDGLASLYAAKGDLARAVATQARANAVTERNVALNLATGSEREKLLYLSSLSEGTDRTLTLSVRLAPDSAQARALAATTVLQRKGRVLDAVAGSLTALRQRFNAEDRALLDQLNGVTARLAGLVLDAPQRLSADEYRKQVRDLEERAEKLEDEISLRSAEFRARSLPVTLAAVQAAIPPDSALIEFVIYRPFDPAAAGGKDVYGKPRYFAYVVRGQGEVQGKDLGEAEALDAAVGELRRALSDPRRKDVRQHARAVDQSVMQPLRVMVGDSAHLFVSPDGGLNLIPFEALADERGGYLIERYSFTYLTSGRDLMRARAADAAAGRPLLVADPAFGEAATGEQVAKAGAAGLPAAAGVRRRSVTAARSLSEVYFAPLGGSAQEALSIKVLFPEAELLTGARATESALKGVGAPRILHLATHGFFLEDAKTAPAVNAQSAARSVAATDARLENPLLRSGLALAGANARRGGGDDGVLTALEASGLNLWGTKLVVLSACDTGLGEVRNGEGVYGLRRAFALAGAESLVMSLWPVSDYATRRLMTAYYRNLKQGMGRGEALRRVRLDLLARDHQLHPFYWANFIQSGEWANLDGRR